MLSAIKTPSGSRYSQSPRHAQKRRRWAASAGGVALLLLVLSWSRHTFSTAPWHSSVERLEPDNHGMLRHLVYINRADIVDRLGCPNTTEEVLYIACQNSFSKVRAWPFENDLTVQKAAL